MIDQRVFNPFPGLRPFRETETHLFFGRDDQIDQLLGQLRTTRFVAVMGASGSGKSSLVRAGLLPALHGGFSSRVGSHWAIATFRPGANPIHNLAAALVGDDVLGLDHDDPVLAVARMEAALRRSGLGLADVARQQATLRQGRLLVVVDQFEELFRFQEAAEHSGGPDDAIAFVQLLIQATRDRDAPIDVIITMRSDFLGDCARFRDLPETVNDGLYLVPRLTRGQLREAIVAPAAVGGATIAPRLVQRLLNDAGADPDLLPVLQHALMRTWDIWAAAGASAAPLDLDHYDAAGGLDDALSLHADSAFDELDERGRVIAETMFKRLTELGADGREVRRPSPLGEIAEVAEAQADEVAACVEHFAAPGRSFVNVSGDDVVDISHESLIRQWPRLRTWAHEEAASRDTYLRLADDAARWERGEAALLRDPDLQLADDWRNSSRPNAAWAARYHEGFDRAIEYLRRSRAAAQRRRRVVIGAVLALAALAVISTVLGLVALSQKNRAETATAEALLQQRQAVSRQLAATSTTLGAELRVPSILTAIEALRLTAPDGVQLPAAEEALRSALREPLGERLPAGADQPRHADGLEALAINSDGSLLVTGGSDGAVFVWDLRDRTAVPIALAGGDAAVTAIAFSPNGEVLAVADTQGDARLWNVGAIDDAPRLLAGHADTITALAFRPDGTVLATASQDASIRLWRLDDPDPTSTLLAGHVGFVNAIDFDPTGRRLASGGGDAAVRIWDVDDPAQPAELLEGHDGRVTAVKFSPDGRRVASASEDSTVRLWDAEASAPPIVLDHRGSVPTVAFSPDGSWLATGSADQAARLWRLDELAEAGAAPVTIRHSDVVEAVAFSAQSRWLATAGRDHTVRLLDLEQPEGTPFVLGGHGQQVTMLAFGPDERRLVTGGDDEVAWVWDLEDLSTRPATIRHTAAASDERADVATVAFEPVSGRLATATTDGKVWLWDAGDAAMPVSLPNERAPGSKAFVGEMAFAPDGTRLATGGGDGVVRLFDPNDPGAAPVVLADLDAAITSLAFAPDGRHLVIASKDSVAQLWDAADPSADPAALDGHSDEVTSAAFSPDGSLLATGSRDMTVLLRPTDDPADRGMALSGHDRFVTAVAFDPLERWLASGSDDGTVVLWRLDGAEARIEHTLPQAGKVRAIAFNPAGSLLAVADGQTVRLWDLTVADPADPIVNPVVLRGHEATVNAVAFGPDGRWLATGANDETARLWLSLDELLEIGCEAAGRNFTEAEWSDVRPDADERERTCERWPL